MICDFLQISAYLDNELNLREQETLELHLSTCSECQQKFSEYQRNRFWLKKAYQQWVKDSTELPHTADLRPLILSHLHEGMLSDLRLSQYLDQEVNDADRQQIETHLSSCIPCGEEYHSLQKMSTVFRSGKSALSFSERDLSQTVLQQIQKEQTLRDSTLTHLSSEHLGDRLSAYLDQDLPEPIQKAFDHHCETCAYCAGQVKQMRSALKLLKSANESTQNWIPEEEPTYPKFFALHDPQKRFLSWNQKGFSQQFFWVQAAMLLFVGVLFWKAPWWNASEDSSGLDSNPSTSAKNSDPLSDQKLAERIGGFQKNLEMALASFPQKTEVSNQTVLKEALKKIEHCLQQNEKLVIQSKMSHSPYEGDLYLIKAILLELELRTYGGFLAPPVLLQKLEEIKQVYRLAIKSFERPFALTHFRLPPEVKFKNLAPKYDQIETLLKEVKEIVLQLEEPLPH